MAAEHSLPPCKSAPLEDAGEKCSRVRVTSCWICHARATERFSAGSNFSLSVCFCQPGFFMFLWQKQGSKFFPVLSHTPMLVSAFCVCWCTDRKLLGREHLIRAAQPLKDLSLGEQLLAFSQMQILQSTWRWSHSK